MDWKPQMKRSQVAEHGKRVLFVNPGKKGKGFEVGRVHIGFTLLAHILVSRGHEVRIVDYAFLSGQGAAHVPQVEEAIREFHPDMVGISAFTFLYDETVEMLSRVSGCTDVPIALGGPHITAFPDDFAHDARVSYIVRGEAEDEIITLVEGAVRQSRPVVIVPRLIEGHRIPAANLDVVLGVEHLTQYQIQLSRGCPYRCSFCTICRLAGTKPRARPLDVCVQELVEIKHRYPGIMSVVVTDDCPTFDRDRFKRFLAMLAEANLGCKLNIDNLRAQDIDDELLELYGRAGGQNICVGVESGNQEVFALVNKGQKLEEIVRSARLVRRRGFSLGLCFVIGLPEDNLERHRDSIALARSLRPDYVFWNMCVPWPETPVAKWFQEHGVIGDIRNFSTLIDPHLSYAIPPAVSEEFPEADRVKAWIMANLETYCIPLTWGNMRKLIVEMRLDGLYRSLIVYVAGKLSHDAWVSGRKIARVLRNMGPEFLLQLLCRKMKGCLKQSK